MNKTAIAILDIVQNGLNDADRVRQAAGLEKSQFSRQVAALIGQGYISKSGPALHLGSTAKAAAYQRLSRRHDMAEVLGGAGEAVFGMLAEPATAAEIKRRLGISDSTVCRILCRLKSMGLAEQAGSRVSVRKSNKDAALLAAILAAEGGKRVAEPHAEVIYWDARRVLKRAPRQSATSGYKTGVSVFGMHGIHVEAVADYYIDQKSRPTIEEAIIHGVCAAHAEKDASLRTIALLVYAKNEKKIDIDEVKKAARAFGISDVWLDAECYLRREKMANSSLFLPWGEFLEKAELYGIALDKYVLPDPFPELFDEIGRRLKGPASAYVIGGENLRIKGLKDRTKDCDLVFLSRADMDAVCRALSEMGYTALDERQFSKEDIRIGVLRVLTHPKRTRMDLFVGRIIRGLALSPAMAQSAPVTKFSKLSLHMVKNEYIFLLKAITSRIGDTADMARILEAGRFDWNEAWAEISRQETELGEDFSNQVLDAIDDLRKKGFSIGRRFAEGIRASAMNANIERIIAKYSGMTAADIVGYLESPGITERMIRNRIDYLAAKGAIAKYKKGRKVCLRAGRTAEARAIKLDKV